MPQYIASRSRSNVQSEAVLDERAEQFELACQSDATTPLSCASPGDYVPRDAVLTRGVPSAVTDTGVSAVRAIVDACSVDALNAMLSEIEPEGPRITETARCDNQR